MFDVDSWVKTHGPNDMKTIRSTLERYDVRLEYRDEISADALNAGGDKFKEHMKRNMALHMGEAMIKKITYTVVENPQRMTKTVRAKVYVFTEQELMQFAREIYHHVR